MEVTATVNEKLIMSTEIQRTILAGIIGTAIMTVVMMLAPMMGIPKMSPPEMLSGMLGMPLIIGWIMHLMIGIVFAFGYTYLFFFKHKIKDVWLRGAVFGIIVFVFAQIMLSVMGMIFSMPKMEGSMMLIMIGNLIGHIVFGMAVAKTAGETCFASDSCETKAPKE
ncbi:hypothetical protein FKX85_05630 [Echinicola soli]|uniref:Uncharacterized protein n=1 Tax=Echinicola soli TaxID=2591634 RepID=A0A514CFH2_9BACT|nr:DUF6789 family protein [Echinicola soli]QDH78538.1 hypothetical protein FKX85_05630 [Echinicola soli]